MVSSTFKSNRNEIDYDPSQLAERIFVNLNQGNLYEIHQILDETKDEYERSNLVKVFVEKFNFNFLMYI